MVLYAMELTDAAKISHDDFHIVCSQLSQFLLNEDKTMLKLNDFNRAEFMLWDDEEKDYCKYSEGHGNGNVSG